MSNLSGKLLRVADPTAGDPSEPGSILLTLCGYGPNVPYIAGGTIANLEYEIVPENPDNAVWNIVVAGNDVIVPAGTYYTFAYKNENGDIAQIVAHTFVDAQDYDITTAPPFDPNQPPPPLPTPILNLLQIVAYSATPEFAGDTFASWQITLAGDATATFTNLVDGNLYTIIIIQDANGAHAFYWPNNVYNTTPINTDANGMTVQTFVAVANQLYPIGAGTYYP